MLMQIAVVDDERLARARLKRLLQEHSVGAIYEGTTGLEALELVKTHRIDILFIDINMPQMNGLDAVLQLDEWALDNPDKSAPAIVFCTAYDQYAIQAFQTNAVAYLLKPFSREQLSIAINKATSLNRLQAKQLRATANLTQNSTNTLAVHYNGGLQNFELSEFLYFKSVDKHVFAVLGDESQILVNQTLKQLQAKFADQGVRIHRSTLLNKAHAGRLLRNSNGRIELQLKDRDIRLAVSRRHLSAVKACF